MWKERWLPKNSPLSSAGLACALNLSLGRKNKLHTLSPAVATSYQAALQHHCGSILIFQLFVFIP